MLGTSLYPAEREFGLSELQRTLAQQQLVEVGWFKLAASWISVSETSLRFPV